MRFVTIVVILLLHLSCYAQMSVNIYAHITQATNIGTLALDKTISLTASPYSAANGSSAGPVYSTTVAYTPPYSIYRNGIGIGGISVANVYPVTTRSGLYFYGEVNNLSYFSVRYVYEMIAPHQITANITTSTQTCANNSITLYSNDNWPLFSNSLVSTNVIWEYSTTGSTTWQAFDSSSSSFTRTFIPALKFPTQSITNFRFRCRIKAKYANQTYYSPYSTASADYTIIPAPPIVSDTTALKIKPACTGHANGEIHLPGTAIISSYSTMNWKLRPGDVTTPCTNNCGDLIDWSDGNINVTDGVHATNIPAGSYTLWLINPGADAGNCFKPFKVIVPEVAALSLQTTTVINPTCHGTKDGVINVQATGGSGYTYTLTTPSGETIPSATGSWNTLPAGDYQATVSDTFCHDMKSLYITLTEPLPITATVSITPPLCNSPADGRIDITTTGKTINLYKDTKLLQTITSNTHAFTGLNAGQYSLRVSDDCPGWDTAITIAGLPPLSLTLLQNDTISCHGDNTGHLQFAAAGGIGKYQYLLSGPVNTTNTTGDFTNLPAGEYSIQLKNQLATCNDILTRQYTVHQKSSIQIKILSTPISCFNATNGSLQAVASEPYHYTWQKLEKPTWFAFGQQIDELEPGTYTVSINSNCPFISDTVSLNNPLPLSIDGVITESAICLEQGATIDITASGGDGQYTYALSNDHGEMYTDYQSGTGIHTAGAYDIRVTDGQGCQAWATDTYSIELPDSLHLQVFTTDITCPGNNDGRIDIVATGGAGDIQYSLNNEPYQSIPAFKDLIAGNYLLKIIDENGCVKSSNTYLTEDTSKQPLQLNISTIKNVYCGNDTTGEIHFHPRGGVMPYAFTLDSENWQSTPAFKGLAAGNYTLQVKDIAGCTSNYNFSITAQDPTIELHPDITPVQCYGFANGSLFIHATGGDNIYHFHWQEPNLTGNNLQQLQPGQYHLTVTDGKGCTQSAIYTIAEPAPLFMNVTATATCDGLSNGTLDIAANGGSLNYTYSIDNKNWSQDTVFNHLSAGDYIVSVKDANSCLLQTEITIGKLNTHPDVNFLVVSQDNVSDTIAVREICLPAPDAVSWAFSPSAEYIGEDAFGAPLIRFTQKGDYWVSMTATFGNCTYTLKKDINILPFDPLNQPVYQLPTVVIDSVMLAPNPNTGTFHCRITLNKKQAVTAFIYDLNGRLQTRRQYPAALLIEDHFELNNAIAGIYILRLLTENDSKDVAFIINEY